MPLVTERDSVSRRNSLQTFGDVVIATSGDAYPELREKQDYIKKVLTVEESSFYKTLDKGMEILKNDIEEMKAKNETVMGADKSFRLYDTYGFPIELTEEILEESGMTLDKDAFAAEMKEQKERARAARAVSNYMGAEETVYNQLDPALTTVFDGYTKSEIEDAKVIELVADNKVASKCLCRQ